MSMRGIDAQIMVQRTADYAREAAEQVRRGDQAQSFLAAQHQAESRMLERTVIHTEQPGQAALQNEKHGSGQNHPDGERPEGRETASEQEEGPPLREHGSVIDILV